MSAVSGASVPQNPVAPEIRHTRIIGVHLAAISLDEELLGGLRHDLLVGPLTASRQDPGAAVA